MTKDKSEGESPSFMFIGGSFAFIASIICLSVPVVQCIRDPQSRFFAHDPQCVEENGTVVITVDDVFLDPGDQLYTAQMKVGETNDLFGCTVTSIEKTEDGSYNVVLWIDSYDVKERKFTVAACSR
ncbi:MAG: hypothetical protein ABIA47_04835 [bacterium]